jgi:hypothetical protein
LVARPASFEAHRSVLEGKWSHFVAVTFGAAWFVGLRGLNLFGQRAAVRIMAIHAGHRPFRQAVFVGFLETGPDIGVAPGAERVDRHRLARYQAVRSILVDGMAGGATYLVPGMTAINASAVSGLIPMAGEADAIGFAGIQLGRLSDIRGGRRFGVLATRPVAALAGFGVPTAFLIGFHQLVRVLLKGVEDVLVTHLAGCGADEFRRLVLRRRRSWSGGFFLSAPYDS